MHELSICQALIGQVEQIARDQGATGVCRVRLGVGPLSGVEPQLLRQAYPIACAGTLLEDSELEMIERSVRVRCRSCGAETDARPNRLLCGACGDWKTQLLGGDELLLEQVELTLLEEAS